MMSESAGRPWLDGSGSLGIRWTIGDVSLRGFEALRLSICGAFGVFGPTAVYAVYVNTVPVDEARRRTGLVPQAARTLEAPGEIPRVLRRLPDGGMAEGAAWKLLPLSAFAGRFELALDNDVILW